MTLQERMRLLKAYVERVGETPIFPAQAVADQREFEAQHPHLKERE
jgi:hypothetical protein